MTTELPSPADLVRRYALPAKKSFGQNFLVDTAVLDRVLDAASVVAGDRVLEIGPGPGGLTSRLLARGADVVCLELDREIVAHLERVFAGVSGLRVVEGDATTDALERAIEDPPRVVVANLPYNVATVILFRLLDGPAPERMALMFQREVADRVVSAGMDRRFGPVGLAVNLSYSTRIALRLKPGAFRPSPAVDSAVVSFRRRTTPVAPPDVCDEARRISRIAFGNRRKMLRSSLSGMTPDLSALFEEAAVDPTSRPEALDLQAFCRLGAASLRLSAGDRD